MLIAIISPFCKLRVRVPAVPAWAATRTNMQLATKMKFGAGLLLELRCIVTQIASRPAGRLRSGWKEPM
jgi:hypothetical protein